MAEYICAQGHSALLYFDGRKPPDFLYTFCQVCNEPMRFDLVKNPQPKGDGE